MRFLEEEDDIRGRDVIEIGCGTGRISVELVSRVAKLTCIDQSAGMIDTHKEMLRDHPLAGKISYITGFAQDYAPTSIHDVGICSLVLIHNVEEMLFEALVRVVARSCRTVFVFEDTSNRQTSEHTRLRPASRLKEAFNAFGMRALREESYRLFDDDLVFLKFVRMGGDGNSERFT